MISTLALATSLILAADPPADLPGRADLPGYEYFEKRDLWAAAEGWRTKHDVALVALDACQQKLATRPATVAANLVLIPPPDPVVSDEGPSALTMVGVGAVLVALGIVIGYVAAPDGDVVLAR
jgi:hypothetical protein